MRKPMGNTWHGAWVTVNHKQIISYKQACWLLPRLPSTAACGRCLHLLWSIPASCCRVRALPHAGIVGLRWPRGGRGVAAVGRHGFRGAQYTQPALRGLLWPARCLGAASLLLSTSFSSIGSGAV